MTLRTNNITDEAGTGAPHFPHGLTVPAGASGAQVPQAQEVGTLADAQLTTHYKRSNILGTVSQSGGVPTGAIIEQGSNVNGRYIRYADGTQICWQKLGVNTTVWWFPVLFASMPIVVGSASNSPAGRTLTTDGDGADSVTLRLYDSNGTNVPHDAKVMAIGRWY